MMLCWLEAGTRPHCKTKDDHWLRTQFMLPIEERAMARERFGREPGAAEFFEQEHPAFGDAPDAVYNAFVL